ncbi:DUF3857 domain-containing transglutaminase family protein [Mesorhizobium sp. IMUNJ 23232]|uniref:DUF3857 domain-containing transglutaminase family protein n=1 Tax=Mesorhizobium sp. IMUNJ 23232 TaxID=3376064 RepID=UPI0037B98F36
MRQLDHFPSCTTVMCRILAILVLVTASWSAWAESTVATGDAESWAEYVELPAPDPSRENQIQNGLSQLLSDYQIKHRPDGFTSFDRTAYKIVDRSGLESGAAINFEFDPAIHRITVNRLHIIRDGVVLDRLPQTKFDVFRREKDAERGIFDGRLSAYADIGEVRVGDIIDIAKTVERTPIVGKGLLYDRIAVQWYEPVALLREKLIWPTSMPLHVRGVRAYAASPTATNGSDTVYSWEFHNPNPAKRQDNLPPDRLDYGYVELTSTMNWQDIVDAVLPHYQTAEDLPSDFAAKIDDIAKRFPTAEDRLVEATRLVQDEIRYVSLSMGAGSYIPRDPATVVASGFGDCKDKALLLASSLKRLGIEAYPALTDIDRGYALGDALPALGAFDHVIVKAVIGGKVYWLDATNYLQGGRAQDMVSPDFGFALPMVPSGASMEKIERQIYPEPTTFIDERFEFPKTPGAPLTLAVTTTYRDRDADTMRYRLASESISKLSDTYLEYYNRQYAGMTSDRPAISSDDRDRNVVIVTEAYQLPAAALDKEKLASAFELKADLGVENFPTPSAVGRTAPVYVGRSVYKRHRATVTNLRARFSGPAGLIDILKPYAELRTNWSSTPSEFEISWTLKTPADQVPATEVADYLKTVEEMKRSMWLTYDFSYVDPVAGQKDTSPEASTTVVAFAAMVLLVLSFVMVQQVRLLLARRRNAGIS